MLHSRRVDGFQFFSGLMAVVAGPIILVTGALAPGWSVLITLAGATVLWAQWKVAKESRNGDATQPRASVPDQIATDDVREDERGQELAVR